MSWSLSIIGQAPKLSAALDEVAKGFVGESLIEFNEARPHLQGLLALEVNASSLFKLTAGGHATFVNGQKINGYVTVSLEQLYAILAT